MSDLINIFSNDIRGKTKKTLPWVKGAWVEFYNDTLAGFRDEYNKKSEELEDDYEVAVWSTVLSVADWNFADAEDKKLPITADSYKALPLKIQRWVMGTATQVSLSETEDEKKKD